MAAQYANKFTLTLYADGTARLIFIDERASAAKGVTASQSTAAEVVLTNSNLDQLADLIIKLRRENR